MLVLQGIQPNLQTLYRRVLRRSIRDESIFRGTFVRDGLGIICTCSLSKLEAPLIRRHLLLRCLNKPSTAPLCSLVCSFVFNACPAFLLASSSSNAAKASCSCDTVCRTHESNVPIKQSHAPYVTDLIRQCTGAAIIPSSRHGPRY